MLFSGFRAYKKTLLINFYYSQFAYFIRPHFFSFALTFSLYCSSYSSFPSFMWSFIVELRVIIIIRLNSIYQKVQSLFHYFAWKREKLLIDRPQQKERAKAGTHCLWWGNEVDVEREKKSFSCRAFSISISWLIFARMLFFLTHHSFTFTSLHSTAQSISRALDKLFFFPLMWWISFARSSPSIIKMHQASYKVRLIGGRR